MKVIINADDFGMNAQANAATIPLMESGHVTSATIMANGAAFDEAVAHARRLRGCSFGVHLNLTEFAPLAGAPDLNPILNNRGCLDYELLRRTPLIRGLQEAVVREWCAQVRRVQSAGITVSHLDSHHHVHTLPKLFPALKRVQRECGIRKVRLSWNIYGERRASRWQRLKKSLWNTATRNIFKTVTTDGFTSLRTFLSAEAAEYQDFQTVELMVHPGHQNYTDETSTLAGDWWRQAPGVIERINYDEL